MRCVVRVITVILACLVVTFFTVPANSQELLVNTPEVTELIKKGEASFFKGDYQIAIRSFSKALELSYNRSVMALHGLGSTFLQLSKFDEAQDCGQRILDISDSRADQAAAENLMGAAFLGSALKLQDMSDRSELLGKAESHLRLSLELSSGQMSPAWLNLSVALEKQGRIAEARDAQQEYVDRTPDNRSARAHLCRLKYLQPVTEQEASTGQSTPEKSDSREKSVQTPGRVEGDVQPPVKVSAPSPQYTEIARKARIQGKVIVEAVIDSFGAVNDIRVLKGLPMGLDREAALAVCQWQFKPATLNGEPVAVIYNLTVNFRLEKGKKR